MFLHVDIGTLLVIPKQFVKLNHRLRQIGHAVRTEEGNRRCVHAHLPK